MILSPCARLLITGLCFLPALTNAQEPPIAIVDVTVIPMTGPGAVPGQTVVVRDGRIATVGPAVTMTLPPGTRVVSGAGHYLIPGLADMHAHISRGQLGQLVANGVTTVRIMWGWSGPVQWRDSIARGELVGPSLFVAGTIIEGTPPPEFADVIDTTDRAMADTEAEARRHVFTQKMWGADFIKVYNNVNAEAYAGVVDQAKQLDLTVAGHVPFDVGLRGVIDAGQTSIEHLRGYIWELVPPNAERQPGRDLRSRSLAWSNIDRSRFASLAELTRASGVANVPTLIVGELFLAPQHQVDAYLERPEARFIPEASRSNLRNRQAAIPWLSNFTEEDFEEVQRGLRTQKDLVRALHDGGAVIMAGTDVTPEGFALHWELEHLADAGLSPYEVLVTATRNPAEFLGWDTGVIAEGRRADLVLLRANPLDDIANTQAIAGVMLRGKYLDRAALDSMLGEMRR